MTKNHCNRNREEFDGRDDDGPMEEPELPVSFGYAMLRVNGAGKLFIDKGTLSDTEQGAAMKAKSVNHHNPAMRRYDCAGVWPVTVTVRRLNAEMPKR